MVDFITRLSHCRPSRITRPPEELRRLLRLLVSLIVALIVGGYLAVILQLRHAALEDAAESTRGVSRLLEEHLIRSLTTTDTILMGAVRVSQARLRGRITPAEELLQFQQLVASLPERGAMLATDAKGDVVTSTSWPQTLPGLNLADRPWFQEMAKGTPVLVGPMFRTKLDNQLRFTVSRPILDDLGHFAGMASVGLDVDVFTDYHKSLVVGQNGFVSAHANGKLILRQPNPEKFVSNPVVGTKILAAAGAEPNATVRLTSIIDNIDRVISFRTLPQYNVVVAAGMAVEEALAPWRQTALLLGGGILVITGGLIGITAMAFRAIGREETIAAGLEATIRQRTDEAETRALEARLANESKTRFLAAASHDLRQPLQAAGMFAEVLSASVDNPKQAQVVDKLRQSIEATNSLLTSLLDVSTLEAGKIKPTITTFRLMPLLTRLVDQLEPEASRKGLSIGAFPCSAAVVSDAVLLERLLRNLVVNAVRYTETGGIRIAARRRGDKIAIQVWDTGVGIPADKLQAVFDDFTRLDSTADRKGSKGLGLGLGLGIVRRMAALLGCKLDLRSTPGKGSCFTVLVPKG